jgi:hypothetical protein
LTVTIFVHDFVVIYCFYQCFMTFLSIDFNVVNPSNNTFNRKNIIITIFVNEIKCIFEKIFFFLKKTPQNWLQTQLLEFSVFIKTLSSLNLDGHNIRTRFCCYLLFLPMFYDFFVECFYCKIWSRDNWQVALDNDFEKIFFFFKKTPQNWLQTPIQNKLQTPFHVLQHANSYIIMLLISHCLTLLVSWIHVVMFTFEK